MIRLIALLLSCRLTTSLSGINQRRATLHPWNAAPDLQLGWTHETRNSETQTLTVAIGWGDETLEDAASIELPYITDEDSLASTLWPAALAGAILCRSPALRNHLLDKNALELGSGLGLTGWTAAESAANCVITDNDERVVNLIKGLENQQPSGRDNVLAKCLEWRDEHGDVDQVDAIIATDVAYYYFLLRPLMDTTTAYMKANSGFFFATGQANRECQWELYHNLKDGCYNQLTDKREPPWVGSTDMLLYKMKLEEWYDLDDEESARDNSISTIPMATLIHRNPDCDLGPLTPHDCVATAEDEEGIPISF